MSSLASKMVDVPVVDPPVHAHLTILGMKATRKEVRRDKI